MSRGSDLGQIDVMRTWWYDAFFDCHAGADPDDVIQVTAEAPPSDLIPGEATGHPLAEGAYWNLFLRGYAAYRPTGAVAQSDPYIRYLTTHFGPRRYDPGLSELLQDPGQTVLRIRRRYAVMDRLAESSGTGSVPPDLEPIDVLVASDQSDEEYPAYLHGRTDPIRVRRLDGYHRLFAARLFGYPAFPCRLSWAGAEGLARGSAPGEQSA